MTKQSFSSHEDGRVAGGHKTTLGKALPIQYGKSKSATYGVAKQETPVYGSSGQIGTFDRALTTGPTLIVGRKGSAGAVHYSPTPCWPIDTVYYAQEVPGTHLPFFRYLFEHLRLGKLDKSTTIPSLSRDDYNAVVAFIPSVETQRAVVVEIEKQFSRLDEAVANLKRVSKNAKSYKGAILTETTCVDRQILPTGWRWSTVGELAEVGTGATPKRDRADYWKSGTVPWVASAAVNKAIVTEPTELITELALKETNCRVYPPGTLLIAMYGEGKTRGTCAQLGIAAATNQALAAIQAPAEIRPYLKLVLQASYLRTRRVASGGVQPNLNLSHVRSIRVPLPSVEDQRRIVEDVDRRLSVVDEIAAEIDVNSRRADRIRQAVLQRAFAP